VRGGVDESSQLLRIAFSLFPVPILMGSGGETPGDYGGKAVDPRPALGDYRPQTPGTG